MARKKLTKSSLDELAKRMPILSEALQMTYIGGYDTNDCWWRCIAYLKSCGIDYDADAAMAIASGYYGDNFDENNYAFSGTDMIIKNLHLTFLVAQKKVIVVVKF